MSRRHLAYRTLQLTHGDTVRWVSGDINGFLETLELETAKMRANAELSKNPNAGSRLMVELAVYTAAADAALRAYGGATASAHWVMADIGWNLYRRMLVLSSLPSRMISRGPERRLCWTLGGLLIFPFRPVGTPGYEAQIFRNGKNIHTRFTHCPPQTLALRMVSGGTTKDYKRYRREALFATYAGRQGVRGK